MPNLTPNIGLNVWLENEPVNFEEVNANFEKIDSLVSCIESGTKTASYSGGSDATATWHYKKYSDGTIDMSAKLEFTNLKCNATEGSGSPYYSGISTAYFPFQLAQVYDTQITLASNTIGWASNVTGRSVLDLVKFRVLSVKQDTTTDYKQVFINVKGVIG